MDAIRAFREKRLADADYLAKVTEIADAIRNRSTDNLPEALRNHDVARAFFGIIQEVLVQHAEVGFDLPSIGASAALRIDEIIQQEKIVNWTTNLDVQNRMKNAIEDYLHDVKGESGLVLSFDEIDRIMEKCLDIGRRRYPG